jgi:hypothetical protein
MKTGCHTEHSDIDIMILFDKCRYAMNRNQRIYRLKKVFRICKAYVRAEKMIFIDTATHPVIKIKLNYGGVDAQIEICAHNPKPVLCTWIIKSIINSSIYKTTIRKLIRSVITFAIENRVHGNKGRAPAISSISYTLLVLAFLQQEGYIGNWNTNLGRTDIHDDELLDLVFNGEDDCNDEWLIEASYLQLPNYFDLRQQFFEYLLKLLREQYRVISIENNFECPDERTLLYVSNPVNLTNTTATLSESKYHRLIQVLENELEWTDVDDNDDDDDDDYYY